MASCKFLLFDKIQYFIRYEWPKVFFANSKIAQSYKIKEMRNLIDIILFS